MKELSTIFIGDNIMAVFAALEMQEKIEGFNSNRQSKNEEPLEIGVGINTGEAVAGNIGSKKRMNYTVIGDVVNFADRVQSQSKAGEILISDSTFRKVINKIAVKKLIPRYVEGKQKEVELYRIPGII
jgi:adenylate cyclase